MTFDTPNNIAVNKENSPETQKESNSYFWENALSVAKKDMDFFKSLYKKWEIDEVHYLELEEAYRGFCNRFNSAKAEIDNDYITDKAEIIDEYKDASAVYFDRIKGTFLETWIWEELIAKHANWEDIWVDAYRILNEIWMIWNESFHISTFRHCYARMWISSDSRENNCIENIKKAWVDVVLSEFWPLFSIISSVFENGIDIDISFEEFQSMVIDWIIGLFDIDNIINLAESVKYNIEDIFTSFRTYAISRWLFRTLLVCTWLWKKVFDVFSEILIKKWLMDFINPRAFAYNSHNTPQINPKNETIDLDAPKDFWNLPSFPDRETIASQVEQWVYDTNISVNGLAVSWDIASTAWDIASTWATVSSSLNTAVSTADDVVSSSTFLASSASLTTEEFAWNAVNSAKREVEASNLIPFKKKEKLNVSNVFDKGNFNNLNIAQRAEIISMVKENFPLMWLFSREINPWDKIKSIHIWWIKWLNDSLSQWVVNTILDNFSAKMAFVSEKWGISSAYNKKSFVWFDDLSREQIQKYMDESILKAWYNPKEYRLNIWLSEVEVSSTSPDDLLYFLLKSQSWGNYKSLWKNREVGFIWDVSWFSDKIAEFWNLMKENLQKLSSWWKDFSVSGWKITISFDESVKIWWQTRTFTREKTITIVDGSWNMTKEFMIAVRKWSIPAELEVVKYARQIFDFAETHAWWLPPISDFSTESFQKALWDAKVFSVIQEKALKWESLTPQEIEKLSILTKTNYKWTSNTRVFYESVGNNPLWVNTWFDDVKDLWYWNIVSQIEASKKLSATISELKSRLSSWKITQEDYNTLEFEARKEAMFKWNSLMTDKMNSASLAIESRLTSEFPDIDFTFTLWWDEFLRAYPNIKGVDMTLVNKRVDEIVREEFEKSGLSFRSSRWELKPWVSSVEHFASLDEWFLFLKAIEKRFWDAISATNNLNLKNELLKIQAKIEFKLIPDDSWEYLEYINIPDITDWFVPAGQIIDIAVKESWEKVYSLIWDSSLTDFLDSRWVWKIRNDLKKVNK